MLADKPSGPLELPLHYHSGYPSVNESARLFEVRNHGAQIGSKIRSPMCVTVEDRLRSKPLDRACCERDLKASS